MLVSPKHKVSVESSYLPLCVHLQNVHHVDHDVLVGFLVFPHSERYGEPAGPTRTHVGLTAVLPPLTHLKSEHMTPGMDDYLLSDEEYTAYLTIYLFH